MSKTVQLVIDNKTYELPVIEGSENEKAIDIKLRAQTEYTTLDTDINTGNKKWITF